MTDQDRLTQLHL